jgi:hypothetical protein
VWETLLLPTAFASCNRIHKIEAHRSAFYRFFRLSQNSQIALAEVEFFGVLVLAPSAQPHEGIDSVGASQFEGIQRDRWRDSLIYMAELECKYVSDYDENGVIYCIGSRNRHEDFSNPGDLVCSGVVCTE